jgi:hypothetical protein
MAFRNVRVPVAAETANQNPIVDFWKKSHDNATHTFVQAIPSVAGRPGVFSARRNRHLTGASGAQFSERTRRPIAASHDRDMLQEVPPKLIAEEGIGKPLLYIRGSTCRAPAALPTREELR